MHPQGSTIRRICARYTAAFLMVAAAATVRAAILGDFGTHLPYLIFYPAVIIAALYGGVGPGLLATALSAAIASFWMEPIGHPLSPHSIADWQGMGIYLCTCILITGVCEAMRRAEDRAIHAAAAAKLAEERRIAALAIQREKELLAVSEEKFRLLVEHAPAAIAMMDRQMRYLAASRRWISDFKLEGRDVIGQCHYDVFPNLPQAWKEVYKRCLAGAVEQSEADSFTQADGHVDWLHWEIRPWRDATGQIGGIIVFTEMVTQQKQMQESLLAAKLSAETARAEAERANLAKDHFLAILSHELRTPLTPVLTTAQMMEQDESLPTAVRESAETIRRNIELEARLIDDLLDLTRISRGKLELQIRTIDVHKKLTQILLICDSDIRSKRLHLDVRLDARAHHVRGDAARLQQVFWNLIKNAVKFTPVGGTITLGTDNSQSGQLSVLVEDNGVGIDPEVLPKIFDAFEQGGSETTRLFGGLGLGLSISKLLMDLHGGSLTAASPGKGHGARFTAALPLVVSVPEETPAGSGSVGLSEAEYVALAGYRILLVEDHADSARAMGRFLKSLGYGVRIADSVATALQAANAESFHLLISDIGLPDGSGLDLMRQLLLKGPVKGIAVSGFGMEQDILRSQEAGFVEHLTKPVNTQHLETVVRRVLESQTQPQPPQPQPQPELTSAGNGKHHG